MTDELNKLRLVAFKSNSDADKAAYFNSLSQAFQRGELVLSQDIVKKIVGFSSAVDSDPAVPFGDTQWRKGYKQACSDIIAALAVTNSERS